MACKVLFNIFIVFELLPDELLEDEPLDELAGVLAGELTTTQAPELKVYPELHDAHAQLGPLEYVRQFSTTQFVTVSLTSFDTGFVTPATVESMLKSYSVSADTFGAATVSTPVDESIVTHDGTVPPL